MSAKQFAGEYTKMTDKLHWTQLSYTTPTHPCSFTAHKWLLARIQSKTAASAFSLSTIPTPRCPELNLSRLTRLEFVLSTLADQIPQYKPISGEVDGWKMGQMGHPMNWRKDTKAVTNGLFQTSRVRLWGEGSRGPPTQWLKTWGDMSKYLSQWRSWIQNILFSVLSSCLMFFRFSSHYYSATKPRARLCKVHDSTNRNFSSRICSLKSHTSWCAGTSTSIVSAHESSSVFDSIMFQAMYQPDWPNLRVRRNPTQIKAKLEEKQSFGW